MKKSILHAAVLAGLGAMSSAHAVNVNPDGLGQVLLYPYFTVQNDFVTAIHVVNTTNTTKAVKVRFLEGKNSQEILDFNLYLSPYDVWTGSVRYDATAGARVFSNDKSCIASAQLVSTGEAFRPYLYNDSAIGSEDLNHADVNRMREGYVEMIEMGTLTNATQAAWVKHNDTTGTPPGCANVAAADLAEELVVGAPTGGLFGTGHLISVDRGVRTSYDAIAIANFTDSPIWRVAGDEAPSLSNAVPPAYVFNGTNNSVVQFYPTTGGDIDAVSAVLTKSTISNEFSIDAGRDAKTDWIVTFPTKRFYVNGVTAAAAVAGDSAPFQRTWWNGVTTAPVAGTGGYWAGPGALQACHDVSYEYWNREEKEYAPTPEGGDYSPRLPGVTTTAALCNEVNTITVYRDGADVSASRLFGAVSTAADLKIREVGDAGWIAMTFDADTAGGTYGVLSGEDGNAADAPTTLTGLPAIGFAAASLVNQVTVQVNGLNVFSSYMGSMMHKGEKIITQ